MTFEKDIEKFVKKTEARLLATTRFALSDLIQEMQTPIAKGGKMPVDTGFLRSSGAAAINELPSGPTKGRKRSPEDAVTGELPEYKISGDFVGPVLSRLKVGDDFCFGWTAVYARRQEIYNGFMVSAVKKWGTFVRGAVKKVNGEGRRTK